jgi:hypothetical protein
MAFRFIPEIIRIPQGIRASASTIVPRRASMEWPSEAIPSITAGGDRATFALFAARPSSGIRIRGGRGAEGINALHGHTAIEIAG